MTKQYLITKLNRVSLLSCIPTFNYLGPGIKCGVDKEQHLKLWLDRAGYCIGYLCSTQDEKYVGLVSVFNDYGPDPHFPYNSVAQIEFTAVRPGFPGAACSLYQHIKSDLRAQGVEALVIPRQVSANEIRARLYKL